MKGELIHGDCLKEMRKLSDESVDLMVTDPPYGIKFMGKNWDKALPPVEIWKECYRVLKSGAFAFVMSIPRADCFSRMVVNLEDAGFDVHFTPIFWTYATGFPKAMNISKVVDKRLGKKRKIIGLNPNDRSSKVAGGRAFDRFQDKGQGHKDILITESASEEAKALEGSYAGFQPKPAVEIVIVAMKPLSEKTYIDQAMKNKHGLTWLGDGRIPFESDYEKERCKNWPNQRQHSIDQKIYGGGKGFYPKEEQKMFKSQGRFPANLLVNDDVLNDGKDRVSVGGRPTKPIGLFPLFDKDYHRCDYGDSGSFSRYFDLDKWFSKKLKSLPESVQKTFPFLIVPKASKREKNKGLEELPVKPMESDGYLRLNPETADKFGCTRKSIAQNTHPTCKPLKLGSYLVILGSREGDIVLDPFGGTGWIGIVCEMLNRNYVVIEIEKDYYDIAEARINAARSSKDKH